jgi:hypothetical protein
MNQTIAFDRLRLLVAADDAPCLDAADLIRLFQFAECPDPLGASPQNVPTVPAWTSGTVPTGTVIRSGTNRYWRAAVGGTTSSTEPVWPTITGPVVDTARITDGAVTWTDNGPTWSPTWDLTRAAAEGWRWKAAKVAGRFDFTAGGDQFQRSQQLAACNAMADRFARMAVSTVTVLRG